MIKVASVLILSFEWVYSGLKILKEIPVSYLLTLMIPMLSSIWISVPNCMD